MSGLYKKIIKKWIRQIEVCGKAENQQFYSLRKESMLIVKYVCIDYDCQIASAIIEIIHESFPNHQIKNSPQKIVTFNIIIGIIQDLFIYGFISKHDVSEIMQHVNLTEEAVIQFLKSDFQSVEESWSSCIIYRMDLFWFIVPYKSIDMSHLILLYQKTIHCPLLRNNQSIAEIYKALRESKQERQRLHLTHNIQLQITADTSKEKEMSKMSFSVNISSIKFKKQEEPDQDDQYFG